MKRSILSALGEQPEHYRGNFYCSNKHLTSLEGAPSFINGNFYCVENRLESLHNIHKQIKRITGYANLRSNPILSHVLGVLQIDDLYRIYLDNLFVETILNKHLEGDRDIFACQEELIEAGLEKFAQL